jgi:hypothetical protein
LLCFWVFVIQVLVWGGHACELAGLAIHAIMVLAEPADLKTFGLKFLLHVPDFSNGRRPGRNVQRLGKLRLIEMTPLVRQQKAAVWLSSSLVEPLPRLGLPGTPPSVIGVDESRSWRRMLVRDAAFHSRIR